MRKMKKLISILVAATMTLAMAAPSFAEGNASIEVKNATKDQTYNAYKVFAATISGEGDEQRASYTATQAQKTWFEGQTENPFAFRSNNNAEPYYVDLAEGKDEDDVIAFLDGLVTKNGDTISVTTNGFADPTPKDGVFSQTKEATVNFDGLDYGYYLVTSSMGAAVSLSPAQPTATIIDKNQNGPSKEDDDGKFVKRDGQDESEWGAITSSSYEGEVNFKVQYTTTNYDHAKRITSYTISDRLGEGLSYVMESGKVVANAYVGTIGSDGTVTKGAAIAGTSITMDTDSKGFAITVPWAETNPSPAKIIVEYSATVDNDSNVNDNSANEQGRVNTANISYTTEDGTTSEEDSSTETTATTKTYALAINKTDPSGNPLEGAEFALKLGETTINVSAVDGQAGVYTVDPDGTATITSPATGVITIKGVQAGSYTVTETKAPNGYNLLEGSTSVDATLTDTYTSTHKVYYNAAGEVVSETDEHTVETAPASAVAASMITVVNATGTTLPSTGGIGTTIFYAAGIILMAGAVFFVVRRRRA